MFPAVLDNLDPAYRQHPPPRRTSNLYAADRWQWKIIGQHIRDERLIRGTLSAEYALLDILGDGVFAWRGWKSFFSSCRLVRKIQTDLPRREKDLELASVSYMAGSEDMISPVFGSKWLLLAHEGHSKLYGSTGAFSNVYWQ